MQGFVQKQSSAAEVSGLGLLCTQPFLCLDPEFVGIGLECIAEEGPSGLLAGVDPTGRVCVFPCMS